MYFSTLGAATLATLTLVQGCAGGSGRGEGSGGRGWRDSRATTCTAEALELGGPSGAPRQLNPGVVLTGRACPSEPDVFLLDTSKLSGELLRVSLKPLQGLAELEARLSTSPAGASPEATEVQYVSQARPGAARRDIGFIATSAHYVLTVSAFTTLAPELASGGAYEVSLERSIRSGDDCCSSATGAGCRDDALLTCLCQLDNACCLGPYDATCVSEARASCDLVCGGERLEADCCAASSAPGCSAPSVEECVCAIDPYCCAGGFDEYCVNLAVGRCGAACPDLERGAP